MLEYFSLFHYFLQVYIVLCSYFDVVVDVDAICDVFLMFVVCAALLRNNLTVRLPVPPFGKKKAAATSSQACNNRCCSITVVIAGL